MKKKQLSNLTLFTNVRHSDDFNLSLASLPISAKRVLFWFWHRYPILERVEEEELVLMWPQTVCRDLWGGHKNSITPYRMLLTLFYHHIYEDLSEEGFKRAFKTNTSGAKYFFDEGYCTVYFNQRYFLISLNYLKNLPLWIYSMWLDYLTSTWPIFIKWSWSVIQRAIRFGNTTLLYDWCWGTERWDVVI